MHKVIFGIFAHPDDEAFGPAGTLLKEIDSGAEVQLVTLTLGEAGSNPDNHSNLPDVREDEWRLAGQLIGASQMYYLGYKDGQLTNNSMIEIGRKLVKLIEVEIAKAESDVEVELLTSDLNGVTGHVDHIVAARAACWAYYTLKKNGHQLRQIRLVCLPKSQQPDVNVDWLYMEPGRSDSEIDEVVDAREYHNQIVAIMRAHHSQRSDAERHIQDLGDNLGVNYFKVLK